MAFSVQTDRDAPHPVETRGEDLCSAMLAVGWWMFDGCGISHSAWSLHRLADPIWEGCPLQVRVTGSREQKNQFVANSLLVLRRKPKESMFKFGFSLAEEQRKSRFIRQQSSDVTVLTAFRLLKGFLQHPAVGVGL